MTNCLEPQIPDVIHRIANRADRHLAWEFFVLFSRFEYALKRVPQYLMPGEGDAQPNWDRFASDLNARFVLMATPALMSAVTFYENKPPRKQLRKDGQMQWSDPVKPDKNEPLLRWLLRSVRIVRNNLFHGGKFPSMLIPEPSRDQDLLAHAITILTTCLPLSADVQNAFMEAIDA